MFSLSLVAALALVAPSLAGAQGIEAPQFLLRTAINEINSLRDDYAAAFNRKDDAALTAMYLPDAVLIRTDGSTLMGQADIGKALAEDAPHWDVLLLVLYDARVRQYRLGRRHDEQPGLVRKCDREPLSGGASPRTEGLEISSVAAVPETHATAAK